MADIIQLDSFKYKDLTLMTNDKKFSQTDLIKRINRFVDLNGMQTQQENSELANFVIKCFASDGIIDTYNDLGYRDWKEMIIRLIEAEKYERTKTNE